MTVTNNFNKSRKILGVNLRHINTPNNKSLINIINTNEINTRRILGNKPRRILGVKLRHINTPRNKTIKNILKTDFGNKIKNVFGVNLKHVEMPNNKSLKNIVRKNEINSKKILGNKMKTVLGVNLRHVKMPNNKTLKNRVDIKEINSKRILERTTPEGKAINTFKKAVNNSIKKIYKPKIRYMPRKFSNNNYRKGLPKGKFRYIEPESPNSNNSGNNYNYIPYINQTLKMPTGKN